MSASTLYLFVDTNVFIQCKPLSEFTWATLSDHINVNLVVPRAVQREIDGQKYRGNDRVGSRARSTYTLFRELLELEDKGYPVFENDNKIVTLFLDEPRKPSDAHSHLLDYSKADDEIVGSILSYMEEYPGRDVRLLTNDSGVMMTARSLHVPFLCVDASWLLETENSDAERKVRRLQGEIDRIKSQEPCIELKYVNFDEAVIEEIDGTYRIFQALSSDDISELTEVLKDQHPLATNFESQADTQSSSVDMNLNMRSQGARFYPPKAEKIERYVKKEYPDWVAACSDILSELHSMLQERSFDGMVQLLAENNGSRPAEDVLVKISALGNFRLCFPSDEMYEIFHHELALPPPPSPPKGHWESVQDVFERYLGRFGNLERLTGLATELPQIRGLDSSAFSSRDPNDFYFKNYSRGSASKVVELECQQWRHGMEKEKFDFFVVADQECTDVQGIVMCEIHAANLSSPIGGSIPVRKTVAKRSSRENAVRLIENLRMR